MSDDLDNDIDEKSSKKKYLTWTIIAIIIVAVIAVPLVLMRQSEPTEATEPTTIEQLENEIDALYVTVYGTDEVDSLEMRLAIQAGRITNIETEGCPCPDYSGQIQNINNDLILLRTDLNAVPDCASNITQVNAELDALSADLTTVETSLLALQAEVKVIEVTDWTSDIATLNSGLAELGGQVTDLQTSIEDLQYYVDLLFIVMPTYSTMVTNMGNGYLDVEVNGGGNYPVVVTLYGSGLDLIGVRVIDGADYDIIDRMLYAGNRILTLFIEPDYYWGMTDMITLVLTGSISYASASVGV